MKKNFLKSIVVLVALAVLVLVPVVEATYLLGHPYIGTTQKKHEVRRWALSGFYEGRELPMPRDRSVNRYYADGTAGRAWRSSLKDMPDHEEVTYAGLKPVQSGRRCLGCELGAYTLLEPSNRRGRYYYSLSRVSGRSKFIFTGDTGTQSKLTTYGTKPHGFTPTGRRLMLPYQAAQRSRLQLDERDLSLLHEEAVGKYSDYELKSGRRCLTCAYRPGTYRGRYYASSPDVKEIRTFVPLQ
ncbi:hypothetical protein HY488_02140 [Candidatus Woesearchaeota archaeon]|nr:hypothetical protein [Candidatus Woesearchaeota archaeon]